MGYNFSKTSNSLIATLDTENGKYDEHIIEYFQPNLFLGQDRVVIKEGSLPTQDLVFDVIGEIDGTAPENLIDAFQLLESLIKSIFVEADSVTTAGTVGVVQATTSFPHPNLSFSINQVFASDEISAYRVALPTATAVIGQKVTVSCIGGYKVLIKSAQAGGGIFINGVNNTAVNEFYIYPNETFEFTYNDNAEWISSFKPSNKSLTEPCKSYVAQIIPQSGSVVTADVSQNTLGTTVTVSWVSGKINIELGDQLMTFTNFHLYASTYLQNGIFHLVTPSFIDFDTIQLDSYKVSGTPSVGWSYGATIHFKLELYN